jgi:steroid 5-alpha reductase family enzyme
LPIFATINIQFIHITILLLHPSAHCHIKNKMAEEDKRFEYIKDRIASAFPKLGSKLDKAITADDAKYVSR